MVARFDRLKVALGWVGGFALWLCVPILTVAALYPVMWLFSDRHERVPPPNLSTEERIAWSRGYSCTSDCSGHEAGWDWAYRNDVRSVDDCSGNSDSFVEGCEAFVRDLQTDLTPYADDFE